MDIALEQFQKATLRLAQEGPVKDRLVEAYHHHLGELEPQQLPEEYRSEFAEMRRAMRRETPLPRENPVRASVRKMSCTEVNRYTTLIVRIFGAAARDARGQAPARALPLSYAPIVQLFAAEG